MYGWKPGAPHRWYGGRKKTTIQQLPNDKIISKTETSINLKIGDNIFIITGDNLVVEQNPGSIISCDKPTRSDLHPTMKPVELVERFIVNSSKRGDIVLDAFGGSGSTLIACEKRGRSCRMIELDPRYVDVIIKRWQTYTGRAAVHEQSGRFFPVNDTKE